MPATPATMSQLEILRHNAAVVGAVWDTNAPARPSHPIGIDPSARRPYKLVSFAAPREYGPEEGWAHVGRKKRRAAAAAAPVFQDD